MKRDQIKAFAAALLISATVAGTYAQQPTLRIGPAAAEMSKVMAQAPSNGVLTIKGTGASNTFSINATNLTEDITLTATAGLEVYPEKLPSDVNDATIRVTLLSTLPETEGKVIIRSGDYKAVMPVKGYGTPLEEKTLADNPKFKGEETSFVNSKEQGFETGENGYTLEFRLKLKREVDAFETYAVTPDGGSLKAYVEANEIGLYNGTSKISFGNPATSGTGGKQQFYNHDGEFHTYRFSVTPDKRVFAYRDGLPVATLRTTDYGNQAEWAIADGPLKENLLKNGNFEGEWNTRATDSLVNKVEGWIVDPIDRYNCTYEVNNLEIDKEHDQYNHVMKLQRYNWNDGWGAGTVSQIVDVAPNSTYSLAFLAQGGMDTKSGTNMSSVKIQEVQDSQKGTSVTITNKDKMEQYGLNYTTSAECKQIKVILHNERFLNGGGWGSSPQPTYIDEMTLSGVSRKLDQKVGFDRKGGEIEYFTYDVTGAYAPAATVLKPSESALTIEGTGSSKNVKINIKNLVASDKVLVSATPGFSVEPNTLEPNTDGEIRVTLTSTLPETSGKVILRAGDIRSYIDLYGYSDGLEQKDIKGAATFKEVENGSYSHTATDGFKGTDNGYTIEFRVNTENGNSAVDAYAVTEKDGAFKAYVDSEGTGLYNGTSKISIGNPETADEGGKQQFYNNDGKAHTYRYAVTTDKRVFVYRDGLQIAALRTSDYGHQAEWAIADGETKENLLNNANFEGEFNYREKDGLLNRVEGWIVDPIDQYNCNYDVPTLEINKDLDHNNHVMKLQRYNWNDGWGAGTVSQIVDVAPNSTYSLAFLAQGGMDTKSGTNMSSVKIQEVQDSQKGTSVTITNKDKMEQYGLNYTTSAECKQIKVILHNERFLNGGGWGSSPQPTYIDEMTLSGVSRKLDQKVGFDNKNSKVEYFSYDTTGAYAPLAPGFGDDLGADVIEAANAPYAVNSGDGVTFFNTVEDASVTIYDSLGKTVCAVSDYVSGSVLPLENNGIFICKIKGASQNTTIKIVRK